jgi:hypothetical protein
MGIHADPDRQHCFSTDPTLNINGKKEPAVKKFCDRDGSETPLLNIFAIARIIPVCNMSAQPTCDCGCIVIIPSVIMAGRALKTFHNINASTKYLPLVTGYL